MHSVLPTWKPGLSAGCPCRRRKVERGCREQNPGSRGLNRAWALPLGKPPTRGPPGPTGRGGRWDRTTWSPQSWASLGKCPGVNGWVIHNLKQQQGSTWGTPTPGLSRLPAPKKARLPLAHSSSSHSGFSAAPRTHQTVSSLRTFAPAAPSSRKPSPPPRGRFTSFGPHGSASPGPCVRRQQPLPPRPCIPFPPTCISLRNVSTFITG